MISFRRILQLAAISAVLPASAATSTAFNFSADGSFKVGNARFQVMTYDANWSPVTNSNWSQRQEKRDDGSRTVSAKLKVGGTTGDVNVSIKTLAADQFRYSAEIDFPEKVKINGNFGALLIPATGTEIRVDGKTVKLPEKFKDVTVFRDKCSKVEVPLAAGLELTVTGKLSLQVQDNRKFDNQTFALRFCFSPTQGEIKNSSLELGFKVSSIRSEPVSLAGSANLGFSRRKKSVRNKYPRRIRSHNRPEDCRSGEIKFFRGADTPIVTNRSANRRYSDNCPRAGMVS